MKPTSTARAARPMSIGNTKARIRSTLPRSPPTRARKPFMPTPTLPFHAQRAQYIGIVIGPGRAVHRGRKKQPAGVVGDPPHIGLFPRHDDPGGGLLPIVGLELSHIVVRPDVRHESRVAR